MEIILLFPIEQSTPCGYTNGVNVLDYVAARDLVPNDREVREATS